MGERSAPEEERRQQQPSPRRDLKRAEEQNGTATVRSFTEFPYVRAL